VNDTRPDQRGQELDAYCASVVEAWRKRPFFVNLAKDAAERLKRLCFRAYLDGNGSVLIADTTGMGRDLSRFMLAADVSDMFDALAAGLAEDPGLLGPPYRPEPQRRNPVRVRAAAAPSQPEPVKSVCPESCAYCGSNEEWTGNLMTKVGVVAVGERAFVHAKCWANWRAAQDGDLMPNLNNSEGSTDDGEAL
jgi:hypothetical protein